MTTDKIQWMVITDLDGTLLNHDTYDVTAAIPVIRSLQGNHIPIILNTSKTYAETRLIRDELAIDDPFIVENGSCIYLPVEQFPDQPSSAYREDSFWAIMQGKSFTDINRIFSQISTPHSAYTRLSQCTIEQAVGLTGLSVERAELAIRRQFSEPVLWHASESELVEFTGWMEKQGLSVIQGGRFLHVMGECGKGRALEVLLQYYKGLYKTIILGDSENDREMLSVADISIVINSPGSDLLIKQLSPDIQPQACAPEGWAEAIQVALPNLKPFQERI